LWPLDCGGRFIWLCTLYRLNAGRGEKYGMSKMEAVGHRS
jgi:hypothetical protein